MGFQPVAPTFAPRVFFALNAGGDFDFDFDLDLDFDQEYGNDYDNDTDYDCDYDNDTDYEDRVKAHPMETRKTAALIPAAGTSSRMGAFKPLLPLGGRTVVEQVIGRFQAAGVADIRVVVGHRAAELIPLVEKSGAGWTRNPRFEEGMLSSVQAGLAALPEDAGAFFVSPADIPLFRSATLSALRQAVAGCRAQVCHPTFGGRRGHPVLIASALRPAIAAWRGEGGLGAFLRGLEPEALEVPVADEGILLDLDTPQDYRRACLRAAGMGTPTRAECLAMMRARFGAGAAVIDHCRAVADIAGALARELNLAGCFLDPDLVLAAGLLHDVAKGASEHAGAGAALLQDLGFGRVGEVVRAHMDLPEPVEGPIDEREVVYLADKLVLGCRAVDMLRRFEDKLARCADNPPARQAVARRRAQALAVKSRIENALGRPLETVLRQAGP